MLVASSQKKFVTFRIKESQPDNRRRDKQRKWRGCWWWWSFESNILERQSISYSSKFVHSFNGLIFGETKHNIHYLGYHMKECHHSRVFIIWLVSVEWGCATVAGHMLIKLAMEWAKVHFKQDQWIYAQSNKNYHPEYRVYMGSRRAKTFLLITKFVQFC